VGQFKDKNGLSWDVNIVIGSVRRVRSYAQIDLTDPVVITTLGDDIFDFGKVMYAICSPQIESRGLTDEQFAEVFDGDTVEAAATCVIEGLIAFTRPAMRPALQKAVDKRKELMGLTTAAQVEMFEGTLMEDSLKREIEKTKKDLQELSGTPSTSTPESSESTPTP